MPRSPLARIRSVYNRFHSRSWILEPQRIIDVDLGARLIVALSINFKSVSDFFTCRNCYMYSDNMSRINNQFSVGVTS